MIGRGQAAVEMLEERHVVAAVEAARGPGGVDQFLRLGLAAEPAQRVDLADAAVGRDRRELAEPGDDIGVGHGGNGRRLGALTQAIGQRPVGIGAQEPHDLVHGRAVLRRSESAYQVTILRASGSLTRLASASATLHLPAVIASSAALAGSADLVGAADLAGAVDLAGAAGLARCFSAAAPTPAPNTSAADSAAATAVPKSLIPRTVFPRARPPAWLVARLCNLLIKTYQILAWLS